MKFININTIKLYEFKKNNRLFMVCKRDDGFILLQKIQGTFGFLTAKRSKYFNTLQKLENAITKL